ncbi:MAG: tetratricopeptide repeat protein [Cyclobacteriaceae bacterium]|jgi:tetratricopeptide (TPR) repeat protein
MTKSMLSASRLVFVFLLTSLALVAFAEPNCNVYKMENNMTCYEACVLATTGGGEQGSRKSQEKFDKAIEQCPTLDYAYMEKSVPYLKRGDFVTWKKLIDKAVELNPTLHLGYRGWCRYQFLRDYRGAIKDFERLDTLFPHDIGYSQNGDYQLTIVKALCYSAIGEKGKAIQIIESQLFKKGYSPMVYDYLHLGVLKMETGDLNGGIDFLTKSIALNDYLAEPYYYLGLIYKSKNLKVEYKTAMEKAKAYYLKGYKRFDPYTHPMHKVYLSDIDRELSIAQTF